MVITGNNFKYKVHNVIKDVNGRYVIIDIELPEIARFLLINIYAPNKDDPTFLWKFLIYQVTKKKCLKLLVVYGTLRGSATS